MILAAIVGLGYVIEDVEEIEYANGNPVGVYAAKINAEINNINKIRVYLIAGGSFISAVKMILELDYHIRENIFEAFQSVGLRAAVEATGLVRYLHPKR